MKIRIHTDAAYDAAHHLENYEGACKNNHGHTYKIEVWVEGDSKQLDKAGILWDFGNVKNAVKEFDHTDDLTKIMGINSTAENQVMYFYKKFKSSNPKLKFKVRVYEQIYPKESYAEVGDF
jgi:6-pyruvoyltetrahydropterin/6-carboxytetrahydropterin synthase